MNIPPRFWIGLVAASCAFVLRADIANVAPDGIANTDRFLYGGASIEKLNDTDTTSVFHGDTDDSPGFYYALDLGKDQAVTELRIFPRQDGCCPDRLSNFRVSVQTENGTEVWGETLYADGTNPGSSPGTLVTIPLPTPQTGRWVKIEALDNPPGDYALQMTELQVFAEVPASEVNRAQGKLAVANQPLYSGQNAAMLLDGNRRSPVHGAAVLSPGFAYTINLGSSVTLSRLVIWARQDGAEPERLSNYRVSILKDDAGQPGAVAWKADLHTDGSNPGFDPGARDVLTAELDAAGEFRGQWIRIESLEDPVSPYALQITEVEAYGIPEGGPNILITQEPDFAATAISRTATFRVTAVAVNGDPSLLTYQWKKNGEVLPGATNAAYTTPPILIADDQAKFQCVVSYPGLTDRASAEATLRVNLAFQAEAASNRPLYQNWAIGILVDGSRSGVVHGAQELEPGFAYTLDLGSAVLFDEIAIYPRQDGCCPDRLRNFRVSVHADDAGALGAENWGVDLFTDGSDAGSGAGTLVTITADQDPNPEHKFEGQWIRILNLEDPVTPYALQINEIEVYGAYVSVVPVLSVFTEPADYTTVPGRTARLSVEAKVVNGDPSKIGYQWFRGDAPIAGATTNLYVTPPLLPADDGALFHCVVTYPGAADVTTRDVKVSFDGNYAKGQPATSNRPLWSTAWNIGMLVDGNRRDMIHGDVNPGAGFAYEIDLGADVDAERIDIYPRQDGCCPERLSNFRVSLHEDEDGALGAENWHADLYTDGSNPGADAGALVTVVKSDGTGDFHGR
ncbi:MAG: discoidin domain-containing protein, partial [Verrucomicrobiae bacterium]|nr:discoidin domain-containing protein [Verrucomicrobiae bacterium]